MDAKAHENRIDYLFTSDLPDNQAERWDMIMGIMDHVIAPRPSDKTSFVSRAIATPEDGSHVINEGMTRVTGLINAMRSHPTLPAVPDLWKDKVESLIASDAYHTMVNVHLLTKPQPGTCNWRNTILTVLANEEHAPFWAGVKENLSGQWDATKSQINRLMAIGASALPKVQHLAPAQYQAVGQGAFSQAVTI